MVYVDNNNARLGDMIMCHMIADSSEELLQMADKIGVKRKWIQKPGTKHEHFDICLSKKKLAIKEGAQEVSILELGYMIGSLDSEDELPVEIDLVKLVREAKENPDWKGEHDITAKVNDTVYCIPNCCLSDALWGMPDNFYPCDKYEWADHPVYFTTIEMVKVAILANESKFKAYIWYGRE